MKKLMLYALFPMFCFAFLQNARAQGVQEAWDNPNVNMAPGSVRPGFAQLTWSPGTVLPIRLRNGMVTMINLPAGEAIEDGTIGSTGLFVFDAQKGGRTIMLTPETTNQGSDTNLIITGKSGNIYLFYLRSEPANASEITYTMVDIVLDNNASLPMGGAGATTQGGGMNSIFPGRGAAGGRVSSPDGEDYGWIKTMKIDPSEFRFDLDIFVPNPDDYVIAPERVWRDRIFTYIDFGDKVIAMTQRPVVSILIEGGESPVGFRTDGEHGRLLIVEAVGDMVLRSGQRIVCIKQRAKPFLIADTASVMSLAEANVAQSIFSTQSFNNVGYGGMPLIGPTGQPMMMPGQPMMMQQPQPMMVPAGQPGFGGAPAQGGQGMNMVPQNRNTAGAFLPQSNIPLIRSNQTGVAVELKSDPSIKALNDHWTKLLAQFSGTDGAGLLAPYKDMVFFAVDEQGVGDLGESGNTARLYRLRIGPFANITDAQTLCDKLQKFQTGACHVVRVQ
ncbi:MAG: TrbG/VirB9 family P-type conjugative transfer protein [Alphaproteobacteria bacterium]|nr:TrbG/VirB9 family P-type conjugative transfer protein [Alphaproteobacteria bacterium]